MPQTFQFTLILSKSLVACRNNKQRLNQLSKMYDVLVLRLICLPSSTHQTWILTNSWPCGYFLCASLKKVGLTEQVHPALKSKLLKMECQVSYWLFWPWVYCCILFIHHEFSREAPLFWNVCATSLMVQALYVALLRIVQLAPMCSPSLNYQIHCRWVFICVMLIVMASVSKPLWFATKCSHL